jgi:hypothetical protein
MTHRYKEFIPFPDLNLPRWPEERKKAPNIMVLDTCSLIHLATPIPEKFFELGFPKDKRPKTYLDLLKLLPKNVIGEIHIPDIVIEELLGYITTKEEATGAVHSHQIDPEIERQHPEEYELCRKFLKQALKGKDRDIIMHTRYGAHYLKELGSIIAELEASRKRDEENHIPSSSATQHWLRQLLDIRQLDGRNLGEINCAKHSLSYAIKNDASVAMVTEDCWGQDLFRKNVNKHAHACELDAYILNVRGVLSALETAGLLKDAGIKSRISIEDHANFIHSALKSRTKNPNKTMDEGADLYSSFVKRVESSVKGITSSKPPVNDDDAPFVGRFVRLVDAAPSKDASPNK